MSKQAQISDLAAYIRNHFDDEWNQHDVDGVVADFAPDATVTLAPPPPGLPAAARGTAEIRQFIQTYIPGFHVSSRNYRVSGDTVHWDATLTANVFRMMGADSISGSGDARIQDGQILSFTFTLDEPTLAKLAQAQQSTARR